MYTMIVNRGTVIRDSDGFQVAPCDDAEDSNFKEYCLWVHAGNQPNMVMAEEPRRVIVVTPRQIRLALNHLGLRSAVETAMSVAAQEVKDTWEFSEEYRSDHHLVEQFSALIGADAYALFEIAETL